MTQEGPEDAGAVLKAAKSVMRKQLLEIRNALVPNASRDLALAQRVALLLSERSPQCVAFYWPMAGEFDLRDVVARWLEPAGGRTAALPVVSAPNAPLAFHAWQPDAPMQAGRYQIPIPSRALAVQPDLLLIPCLGFDATRRRLGYGGGFYDRTLATLAPRPYTAGVAFEASRVAALPLEAHDVPLDTIVSEVGRY